MKNLLKNVLLSAFIAPALAACGNAPQIMAVPPQMLRPMHSPQFVHQNTPAEINAQYWLGEITSSGFSPDKQNSQFGFDYVNIRFNDHTTSSQSSLNLSYQAHQQAFVAMFTYTTQIGSPEQKTEHFSHQDLEKIKELNFLLPTLSVRNTQDTENLQRILNKLGKALGQPPRRPIGTGGSLSVEFPTVADQRQTHSQNR